MCLEDDTHVQLSRCPHGAFFLRVGNTTLHLKKTQVLALHAELNRCVETKDVKQPKPGGADVLRRGGYGPTIN